MGVVGVTLSDNGKIYYLYLTYWMYLTKPLVSIAEAKAGRPRPRRPEIPLYHTPANLSREIFNKFAIYHFLKFVHFNYWFLKKAMI